MNSLTSLPLAILGIGTPELIGILLLALLFFGGSKLPGLAKGLGQSIKEFKKAQKDDEPEEKPAESKPAAPANTPKADGKN